MNLKELIERRNALAEQANAIVEAATKETRALTEDEKTEHTSLTEQIRALDETIELAKNAIDPAKYEPVENLGKEERAAEETAEQIEKREIKEFASYIRGVVGDREEGEVRAAANLDLGKNGAIIPKTIANMIVKQVVDISPIYAATSKFNVKGTLGIPYYDETSDRITVAWAEEFKTLESHVGNFTSVELSGHLAAALTMISKSLINNNDFDLVSFVVNDMAEKVALFIEAKLLHVDEDEKVDGLKDVKIEVTAASATEITADELILLQDSIKDRFQRNAAWVMNMHTRTALRQLKDQEGRYMLQGGDITTGFGGTLLGKPIWVSDAMPDMAADKIAIYYGDYSGLAVQNIENPEIEILRELFALQHAVGANVWFEFDSRVIDAQKIARLKMAAA